MWCKLADGNTLPSCFLTSRMNRMSQCQSSLFDICTMEHICTAVVVLLPTIESMQYCVSSKVFLGTPSVLSLRTSSSVFGSANLQWEELVGGLC